MAILNYFLSPFFCWKMNKPKRKKSKTKQERTCKNSIIQNVMHSIRTFVFVLFRNFDRLDIDFIWIFSSRYQCNVLLCIPSSVNCQNFNSIRTAYCSKIHTHKQKEFNWHKFWLRTLVDADFYAVKEINSL